MEVLNGICVYKSRFTFVHRELGELNEYKMGRSRTIHHQFPSNKVEFLEEEGGELGLATKKCPPPNRMNRLQEENQDQRQTRSMTSNENKVAASPSWKKSFIKQGK